MASKRLLTSLRCVRCPTLTFPRYNKYAPLVSQFHAQNQPTRFFTSSLPSFSSSSSSSSDTSPSVNSSTSPPPPQYQITFTCTAPSVPVGTVDPDAPPPQTCSHRSTHTFTKNAYEHGIVLIECPSCKNRHLIADHLGWFDSPDLTDGGKMATVEDILRRKGEHVHRASADGLLHLPTSSS